VSHPPQARIHPVPQPALLPCRAFRGFDISSVQMWLLLESPKPARSHGLDPFCPAPASTRCPASLSFQTHIVRLPSFSQNLPIDAMTDGMVWENRNLPQSDRASKTSIFRDSFIRDDGVAW
jgi:hypothetical protein